MELSKKEIKIIETACNAIVSTIELKDPHTARHLGRTAFLASRIAESMGLPVDRVRGIYFGAFLHDIGIMRVPSEILYSIRKLMPEEMDIIRKHPTVGKDIVKDIPFPWPVKEIIMGHHERLDGSGYPNGLKGDDIPLDVRIVTVADVYESMISRRPYSPSRSIDEAATELEENAGRLYDHDVVDHCIPIIDKIDFRFPEKNFLLY